MNVFDQQDKWLMRLCFGIAFLLFVSIVRLILE